MVWEREIMVIDKNVKDFIIILYNKDKKWSVFGKKWSVFGKKWSVKIITLKLIIKVSEILWSIAFEGS